MIDRILLDLDGVLVNFVGGACKLHNKPWPYTKDEQGSWDIESLFGMTSPAFWSPLGYEFWRNLDPYPHMHQFVEALERKFGEEHICLLTSPPKQKGAIEGKIDFIRDHLPQYRRRFLVGPAKEFCASPRHALIDDSDANIEKFRYAGGQVFLVPGPWNHRFKEEPLPALLEWLDSNPS